MREIFPFGRPVSGQHLVGRDKIVAEIIVMLESGQSIMLSAPRRYGKTSVVLEVLRKLKLKDYYIGTVDIFATPSRRRLAEKIVETTLECKGISGDKIISIARSGIDKLRKAVKLSHITRDGYEIVLSFAGDVTNENIILDEALDFPEVFSKKHKKKMVFAYDEFGDIEGINGNLIKNMRSKFQKHKNVTYIFTGSQESLMNRLFTDKKEAFYGFCRIIDLPKIPEDSFATYIINSYKRRDITISKETVKNIVMKTECHPYYTQYVCHVIYFAVKGEKNKICMEDVELGYKSAMELHRAYFDNLWHRIMQESMLQLKLLIYLAANYEKSPYTVFDDRRQNIYAALTSLMTKGMILKENNRYRILDPLFKNYIVQQEKGESTNLQIS